MLLPDYCWVSQVVLVVKNPPASVGEGKRCRFIPGSGKFPGGGHGNPLQHSCLENPMDWEAWWATVHRVPQSQTGLKWLSMHVRWRFSLLHPSLPSAAAAKSLQSCPTLCHPIDGSSPGSPVPGTLQARILDWVAISFSNAWKWKVKVKSLSHVRLLVTPWTAAYQGPFFKFSCQLPQILLRQNINYRYKDTVSECAHRDKYAVHECF